MEAEGGKKEEVTVLLVESGKRDTSLTAAAEVVGGRRIELCNQNINHMQGFEILSAYGRGNS